MRADKQGTNHVTIQSVGFRPVFTGGLTQPHNPRAALPAAGADHLTFGATAEPTRAEKLSPPSRTFNVQVPSGRTLHMRRWWQKGTNEPPRYGKAPVFLLIHGLGGRSAWMAPMVDELLKKQNLDGAQFYGIDMPNVGQHPMAYGNITEMNDMVGSVRDAINYVAEQHQGPVFAIGLSFGGLLLSCVAADKKPPAALKRIALISPALKPHPSKASPGAYASAATDLLKAKLTGKSTPTRSLLSKVIPPPSSNNHTPLQNAIRSEKGKADDRVSEFTFTSYLKMFRKMMYFRDLGARHVKLPVAIYGTETDDLVDPRGIKESFGKFQSAEKSMKIYPSASHDLILDPLNQEICDELSRFFAQDMKQAKQKP